jgi:hypothetical protein
MRAQEGMGAGGRGEEMRRVKDGHCCLTVAGTLCVVWLSIFEDVCSPFMVLAGPQG